MGEKINTNVAEYYNWLKKSRHRFNDKYDAMIREGKVFVEFKFETELKNRQKIVDGLDRLASTVGVNKFGLKKMEIWKQGMINKANENFIEIEPEIIRNAYYSGLVLYSSFFKYGYFYHVFGNHPRK